MKRLKEWNTQRQAEPGLERINDPRRKGTRLKVKRLVRLRRSGG